MKQNIVGLIIFVIIVAFLDCILMEKNSPDYKKDDEHGQDIRPEES